VAAFDGVDLAAEAGSGGICEIANARPGPPYLYQVPGGGQVVVPESGAVAIVREVGASGYLEALGAAREAANKGLDMALSKEEPQRFWITTVNHTSCGGGRARARS
jgi:hypothetical protein